MANYVNNPAFTANGNTICLNATTASSNGQLRAGTSGTPRHVRIFNSGSVPVFVALGTSAIVAVIPTTVTPTASFPVGPGAIEIFAIGGGNSYIAAISAVSSSQVYCTPGEGI